MIVLVIKCSRGVVTYQIPIDHRQLLTTFKQYLEVKYIRNYVHWLEMILIYQKRIIFLHQVCIKQVSLKNKVKVVKSSQAKIYFLVRILIKVLGQMKLMRDSKVIILIANSRVYYIAINRILITRRDKALPQAHTYLSHMLKGFSNSREIIMLYYSQIYLWKLTFLGEWKLPRHREK